MFSCSIGKQKCAFSKSRKMKNEKLSAYVVDELKEVYIYKSVNFLKFGSLMDKISD